MSLRRKIFEENVLEMAGMILVMVWSRKGQVAARAFAEEVTGARGTMRKLNKMCHRVLATCWHGGNPTRFSPTALPSPLPRPSQLHSHCKL